MQHDKFEKKEVIIVDDSDDSSVADVEFDLDKEATIDEIIIKNQKHSNNFDDIDSLWYCSYDNYHSYPKLYISRVFSENGNSYVELMQDGKTQKYEYSFISSIFPDAMLSYMEQYILPSLSPL